MKIDSEILKEKLIDEFRLHPNVNKIIDELTKEEMKKLKPCYLSDGTEETGKRIIEELMKVEGATNHCDFIGNDKLFPYYFLDNDNDVFASETIPEGYVLTPLPKETKELTFPRWMMVKCNRNFYKRLVISNHNNLFQAINIDEEDEFYKGGDRGVMIFQYEHAKEIEVEQPKEEAKEDRIQQLEKALEEERSKNEKIKELINNLL